MLWQGLQTLPRDWDSQSSCLRIIKVYNSFDIFFLHTKIWRWLKTCLEVDKHAPPIYLWCKDTTQTSFEDTGDFFILGQACPLWHSGMTRTWPWIVASPPHVFTVKGPEMSSKSSLVQVETTKYFFLKRVTSSSHSLPSLPWDFLSNCSSLRLISYFDPTSHFIWLKFTCRGTKYDDVPLKPTCTCFRPVVLNLPKAITS